MSLNGRLVIKHHGQYIPVNTLLAETTDERKWYVEPEDQDDTFALGLVDESGNVRIVHTIQLTAEDDFELIQY